MPTAPSTESPYYGSLAGLILPVLVNDHVNTLRKPAGRKCRNHCFHLLVLRDLRNLSRNAQCVKLNQAET
ncbi:hypothetical protein PM082_020990 [Marasmius tenuissimus]|nr:hypothetical protein PM082_020990 [Marasmius tenuissimus]